MRVIKAASILVVIFLFVSCNTKNSKGKTIATPSDEKATVETMVLYSKLKSGIEKGIMLGHQDALAYGNNWFGEQGRSDVKSVCGDYPAVFGWDLGKIETGAALNVDSVPFSAIKSYVVEADRLGGISTFSWHADNPVTKGGVNDCSQENTISEILTNKATQAAYLASLDKVADFFSELKNDAGTSIPVIFRPFHEHNITNTFWWNTVQCSANDYKRLWILTVDYLRNKRNIHNVLYTYSVYCSDGTNDFSDYYPGDKYVDIVGISSLMHLGNDPKGKSFRQTLNRNLAVLTQFAEKNNKIPAITTTGLEGIKIPNFFSEYIYPVVSQYKLSYIMFWRNAWNEEKHYFIPVPGHPASEDFVRFVNYPNILTCNKIG